MTPQYLIKCAKYKLQDVFHDDNPDGYKERIERQRKTIREDIKRYRELQQELHDILHTKNELKEWLKSIGEYETGEQETA